MVQLSAGDGTAHCVQIRPPSLGGRGADCPNLKRLLQDSALQAALDASLLDPIRRHLVQAQSERQARAASTRVDFFTVARESGGTNGEEDQQ